MISIDDGHPPPDPSSSHHHHHHHHLNINTDDDYKPSASVSNSDLKFPDADLDDTNTNTNNPLPNFSIRDHVFGLRSKDVACNWPFSSQSLQLCLRNGVKNLLPPFQPLDLLRNNNSSITKCNLETRLACNEELVTRLDGKPTENRFKPVISDAANSNQELPVRSISVNSSGSKENKESNTRSKEKPLKKSRLVLKLNSGVDPVDQLDLAPNSFIVSETMASKICPVCKIFTSSSNTTLNAHIDQCLTGEASMKWTDNSKVNIVKHRVKPRKTRLMSDIYETAPHCTIEELDRRNGTSWATNSSFPAQEFEFQEEKEEKEEPRLTATINPEVADNEGDVYIDTDGTKVRILSVPKACSSDNNGARKLLKGVKGCKIVIGKKKHNLFKAKHHQKYLKLGSNAAKLRSPKPSNTLHASEIVDEQISGQEEGVAMAESCGKEEGGREPMKARMDIEVAGLAIVRPPWACSKRTRLNGKRRQLGLPNDPRKDFLVESDKSSPSSQIQKKTRTLSPLTTPSSNLLTKDDTFTEGSQDSYPIQHSDGPDIRRIVKNSKFSSLQKNLSFSAAKTSSKRKFSAFQKSYLRCLLKEKSVEGQSRNSPNEQSRMEKDDTFTLNDSEGSQGLYPIQHSNGPDIRQIKNTKFSSFKKNPSFSAPKISSKRKLSAFQKSYLRCLRNEKSVEGQSQNSPNEQSRMEDETFTLNDSEGSQDSYPIQHSDGPDISPIKNTKFSSFKKNPSFSAPKTSSKRKLSAFQKSYIRCLLNEKSVEGQSRNSPNEQSRMEEDTDSARKESSNGESSEDGGLMGLSNSFDPEFSKLVAEPNKPYDQDQICSTNRAPDGKNIFGNDIELDDTEDIEKHQDYFQEVDHIDPIPIPGPPGSFLPSPGGDMVSEEIQPIRVPPTENPHNHDTIDQDSMSNSPVSTVSNPSLARSDSRSSEKLSFRSSSVQDDQRPGFSGFLIEPTFKKSFPVDHIEKGKNPTNFKNDQPCCCSRKESALSYSAASSYQDSPLLRKQQPTESTRNPNGFINFRSESMFLLNNYPTSQPPDTTKISVQPTGSAVKLPIYSDCDSAASPSKPVLRLMGKNLTVVKTDEDVSSTHQFRSPTSQLVRNDPKEDHNSFSQNYPHRPVVFSQYQNGSESNHFNGQPQINMRSFIAATAAAHGGLNLGPMVPPARSHYGYNGVNSQMPRGRNMYNSVTSSNPIKEIIVIDDSSPENEADDSMRNEFLRRNSSGQMNQFYSMYQSQGYDDDHHHPYGGGGGGGGPAVFRGGGYQTSLGMQMGSSSPSNSTSHLRSSTSYYPPSYP